MTFQSIMSFLFFQKFLYLNFSFDGGEKETNYFILIYQGKKWFGEDGRIKSLPDPLKKISSRVPVPEEQELNQHTLYRKVNKFSSGQYCIHYSFLKIILGS